MSGFPTLLYKEVLRFWKVSFQTVALAQMTDVVHRFIGHTGRQCPVTNDSDNFADLRVTLCAKISGCDKTQSCGNRR